MFINYILYLFLLINKIIAYYYWKEISGNLGREEKEGEREGGMEEGTGVGWEKDLVESCLDMAQVAHRLSFGLLYKQL